MSDDLIYDLVDRDEHEKLKRLWQGFLDTVEEMGSVPLVPLVYFGLNILIVAMNWVKEVEREVRGEARKLEKEFPNLSEVHDEDINAAKAFLRKELKRLYKRARTL